jgi:alanine racemase
MDMITVYITDLCNVSVGDIAELWGKNISIDDIAQCSNTINYELLTRVSKRVPKVFAN